MSFFQNLFNGDDDKKKKNDGGGGPKNPFANLGQKKFQGSGKSLGGSDPGNLIHIELKEPGTLGMKVCVCVCVCCVCAPKPLYHCAFTGKDLTNCYVCLL